MYIYQTMSNNFGFIVLRLRNILGSKTGHEAKIPTSFDEKKFENYKPQQQVKPLADTGPEGDEKKDFLKGAEIAYETIITAFANGNKEKLTKLLTSEMKTNFYEAIEQRKRNGITSELTFIGFKNSSIEKFEKIKNEFFATVKFVSEIISVKKDRDNRVIEGNSNKIKIVTDYWKFSKKISSKDPNWFLSEIISK